MSPRTSRGGERSRASAPRRTRDPRFGSRPSGPTAYSRFVEERDPYDDGLSVVFELSRPASEEDVAVARDLLEQWAAHYRSEGRSHRNAGLRGKPGDRRIEIYLDRVVDPDGVDAIAASADALREQAAESLPVASSRVDTADRALDEDIAERTGAPRIVIRPGGDAVADLRRRGLLPQPSGLRPSFVWLLPIILVRLCAVFFEQPLSGVIGAVAVAIGVPALAIASRRWCGMREHALAGATTLAAAISVALGLGLPGEELPQTIARFAIIGFGIAWVLTWLGRGRSPG
jgi:hypothetical protein